MCRSIRNFAFYDLRHDTPAGLSGMGFNTLKLRAISGHTSANMLQRYASIDKGALAKRLACAPSIFADSREEKDVT